MAFFPCIYFTGSTNPTLFRTDCLNYRNLTEKQKFDTIIERADNRNEFYKLLYRFCAICLMRGLRLIIENPFGGQHYLENNFLCKPSYIDKDRSLRGDYFKKPTAYWFFNCIPTQGFTWQKDKKVVPVWDKASGKNGLCSEERSMIAPDYARNFICDNIIGKVQKFTQLNLFDL